LVRINRRGCREQGQSHPGDLEREYRKRRSELLEDPALSWEKKMRGLKDLFEEYHKRQADLEDEQGAA
jgi:hypothetical protein